MELYKEVDKKTQLVHKDQFLFKFDPSENDDNDETAFTRVYYLLENTLGTGRDYKFIITENPARVSVGFYDTHKELHVENVLKFIPNL